MNRLRESWRVLEARFGARRVNPIAILLLVGIGSIVVRLLIFWRLDTTALLYVCVPYGIALLIASFRPLREGQSQAKGMARNISTSLMVMFGSSIVLFEGFVCVLFFLPIYLIVVLCVFLLDRLKARSSRKNSRNLASLLPLLLLASGLEGTHETLSFERLNRVTITQKTNLSPAQIAQNLSLPFSLKPSSHWLLSVFPMPYEITAGSLSAGDVHKVKTRYHRWFITNTHEGELHLEIAEVQPLLVRTKVLHDTTYFANYVRGIGTEIHLRPTGEQQTEITLHVDYERILDPAWYFHPIQRLAVAQMGELLIEEVMIRD